MTGPQTIAVEPDEADQRIDRWLRRRLPHTPMGQLQKWLRTGQVRVDGRRVKGSERLAAGQAIRLPPQSVGTEGDAAPASRPPRPVTPADAEWLRDCVLHCDQQVLVINKPAGLAVQGGSGTHRHLDAMLDALRFDARERPRLVHRLDKDTSGVLLLARSAKAAVALTAGFRLRETHKLYWAVVAGCPHPVDGRIVNRIGKKHGPYGDRMEADEEEGKMAVTFYRTLDHAGRSAAFLALEPHTGRTHQLRVHCALLGTPILGDSKYGGEAAFLGGHGVAPGLHLHARAIRMPHPAGGVLEVKAPPSPGLAQTMRFLGFQPGREADLFLAEDEG